MKSYLRVTLLFVGMFLFSSKTWSDQIKSAVQTKFEIWTGSLASASVATVAETDVIGFSLMGSGLGSGSITGVLAPSVGYFLSPRFELIASVSMNHNTRKTTPLVTTTSLYRFTGGLAYNFSEEIESSYYLRTEAGVSILSFGSTDQSYFTFSAQVGKRFKLVQNISYVPNITFEMISTLPAKSLSLALVPLQFSLLF